MLKKILLLSALFLVITATYADFPVKVMFYPSVTRDDSKNIIFNDRMSQLGVYFFKTGSPIPRLDEYAFSMDFPESVKVLSAVVIQGWVTQEKITVFKTEKSDRSGYIRYFLPIPKGELNTLFKINDATGFTGFHTIFFIAPNAKETIPAEFTSAWTMQKGEDKLTGVQEFQARPFIPAKSTPKKFSLWSDIGSRLMDVKEMNSRIELFKGMGINFVDANGANKFVPDSLQILARADFNLYSGNLQQFIFVYDRNVIGFPAKPEECIVKLDGKNVFGTSDYRNTPWCPAQFYNPRSRLFQKMLRYVKAEYKLGVRYFYSDHEVDFFNFCYCPVCLSDYAKFTNKDYDSIKSKNPVELVTADPYGFYRFRCWQSGQMCVALRQAVGPEAKDLLIGMNSAIIYINYQFENLGWGRSIFSDDTRLVDPYVDFHNIDTLSGGIMDSTQLDAFIGSVKKPVITRTHSSYCYSWLFSHCSTRYEQARAEGRKMGYDQRPEMQLLSMLNLAATGGRGLELLIHDGSFDAAVANAIARGTEIIAHYEPVWLEGKRCEDKLKVYNLSPEKSPYFNDNSTIGGKLWANFFFRIYGPLMYRMHEFNNELTISFFNWDAVQTQKVMVVPNIKFDDKMQIFDYVKNQLYIPSSTSKSWTGDDLNKGIAIEIKPLDFVILTITPNSKLPSALQEKIASGSIPANIAPYNLYHYRRNQKSPQSLEKGLEDIIKKMKQ